MFMVRNVHNRESKLHKTEINVSSVKCFFAFAKELDSGHLGVSHGHICTEIVLNYGCSGSVFYDETKALEYQDKTLFIYQPGHKHRIENNSKGVQYCLGISGCEIEKVEFSVLPVTAEIEAISDRLMQEAANGRPYMSAYMDLLAGQMAIEVLRIERLPDNPSEIKVPQYAHKAREIIDTTFDKNIVIGDIAKSLFISPDYLRQLFQETFDESPMQYLIHRRIEHARHLLWQGDLLISEVARDCGIPNEYYFSRLFRKFTGLTPSAYRKKYKKK